MEGMGKRKEMARRGRRAELDRRTYLYALELVSYN